MTDISDERSNDATRTSIHSVNLRIPEYYPDDPECWLAQLEAQFDINRINSQLTRYRYLVGALPRTLTPELRDLIVKIPLDKPYDTLKAAILQRTAPSETSQLETLLTGLRLEGRTPSQLLRHMRQLAGTTLTDDKLLKHIWLKRLPESIATVLSAHANTSSLADLAASADKIHEYVNHTTAVATVTPVPQVSQIPQPSELDLLNKKLQILQLEVQKLQQPRSSPPHRYRSSIKPSISRPRSTSRSSSRDRSLCFYHNRFGDKARKCEHPCSFSKPSGN